MRRIIVFQDLQTGQQVLVEVWSNGEVTCATRPEQRAAWGPPLEVREDSYDA